MSFVLDPDKGAVVFACGHKGAGKSVLAEWYFRAYPYPRLVVDANGDVDAAGSFTTYYEPKVELVRPRREGKPPVYLSERPELEGLTEWPSWRYEIDYTDPDWPFVVDAVIGEPPGRHSGGSGVLGTGMPTCVWIDEVGELASAGRTPPRLLQHLHKLRHVRGTLILSGPRAVGVEPLCLSQADLVAMFDTPHELDRDRLAQHLQLPARELASLLDNLEEHGYLAFEGPPARQLSIMPPLPLGEMPKATRGESAR